MERMELRIPHVDRDDGSAPCSFWLQLESPSAAAIARRWKEHLGAAVLAGGPWVLLKALILLPFAAR